uniref:Uncharacterized protein n=1 Tax=Tanacetum cinerariifolium TaxID=118510 RepID=A0A699GVL7_TANCI|nr:hypothetical protein [Tanacetum cinerariifolium]
MAALKFVDSYNMVAYLERPTNSDDFTEMVYLLNANTIRCPLRMLFIMHLVKKAFTNMKRIGKDILGKVTPLFDTMLIQHQLEVGEGLRHPTDPQYIPTTNQPPISEPIIAQSSDQPINTYKPRKPKKKVTQIHLVVDEALLKKRGDNLKRAATTTSSLEIEQVNGNITKTQSKATLNEPTL